MKALTGQVDLSVWKHNLSGTQKLLAWNMSNKLEAKLTVTVVKHGFTIHLVLKSARQMKSGNLEFLTGQEKENLMLHFLFFFYI